MLIWTGRGVATKRVTNDSKKVVKVIKLVNGDEIPEGFFSPERLKLMQEKGKVTEIGKPKPKKQAAK